MQTGVVRTAQLARLKQPSLFAFLGVHHCRRMSIAKADGSTSHSRSSNVSTRKPRKRKDTNLIEPRKQWGLKAKESEIGAEQNELQVSIEESETLSSSKKRGFASTELDLPEDDGSLSAQKSITNAKEEETSNLVEHDIYREDDYVWQQAPNPPLPSSPPNPHPVSENISASAAAIAYLRFRGLADHEPQSTFYYLLAWVLRHAARDLGFEIVPDGFVRITDLLRFEPFRSYTIGSFAHMCINDRFDRFEVTTLPDLVDGRLQEIWWARARATQTILGVHASNKRIINMGKLQTVIYRAPFKEWPQIRQYGIREGPDRLVHLHHKGASYFKNLIPRETKYVCITIDAQRAAELGVKFFHTPEVDLVAVGRNGVIPVEAIRSVVELDITKQDLI